MTFEWLFRISVVAGFVGAMTGMGGGVILIPAMTLLGVDIKRAIAVSIVSVIATSGGAASAYSLGIAALMLTPYVRAGAPLAFFLLVERNWKYAAFTAFVLAVLSCSLFLR